MLATLVFTPKVVFPQFIRWGNANVHPTKALSKFHFCIDSTYSPIVAAANRCSQYTQTK